MSALRNLIPRRTYKERAQPHSRKKFGPLEKHKDYVLRAKNFNKKQQILQNLKKKAAFRNPDEFYFKMINTKTVDGVHKPKSKDYTHKEVMLMKAQDIGYVRQKNQAKKKKIRKLMPPKRVYFAEDREEAKEIESRERKMMTASEELLEAVERAGSKKKTRVQQLERLYTDMTSQKALQNKGRKRKLREDEIVCPTSRPVYKWQVERKR